MCFDIIKISTMRNLAVVFDWGGVLMRTVDYSPRFAWDDRLNLPRGSVESVVHGSDDWHLAQHGKITLDEYWHGVGRKLGLTPIQLSELRVDFYSGDRVDQSLVVLIRDLRNRGLRVGLLSNYTTDLADIIAREGLDGLFDAAVISAAIGVMKPNPAAYQAILDELSVESKNVFFIDDFEDNVKSALALGINAVRFTPELKIAHLIESWISEKSQ